MANNGSSGRFQIDLIQMGGNSINRRIYKHQIYSERTNAENEYYGQPAVSTAQIELAHKVSF
jgi:hypothetical protein